MFLDADLTRAVMDLAHQGEGSFVFGAIESTPGHDYNAAYHLGPNAERIEVYRKRHLVPFGEYAPFVHVLPFMRYLVPFQVGYTAGEKPETFTLPRSGVKLAPIICFEDTLAGLCHEAVQPDAEVLLNITNDAWFKSSPGPAQHLANAIFRTVELDRPLLRASNSGITCAVSQRGRLVDLLQIDGKVTEIDGVLSGVLTWTPSQMTPYERWGEWIVLISAAVCLMVAGSHWKKKA
jgi:apolipoprotein N-acyltransferase